MEYKTSSLTDYLLLKQGWVVEYRPMNNSRNIWAFISSWQGITHHWWVVCQLKMNFLNFRCKMTIGFVFGFFGSAILSSGQSTWTCLDSEIKQGQVWLGFGSVANLGDWKHSGKLFSCWSEKKPCRYSNKILDHGNFIDNLVFLWNLKTPNLIWQVTVSLHLFVWLVGWDKDQGR